jgi:hypothetical protein
MVTIRRWMRVKIGRLLLFLVEEALIDRIDTNSGKRGASKSPNWAAWKSAVCSLRQSPH